MAAEVSRLEGDLFFVSKRNRVYRDRYLGQEAVFKVFARQEDYLREKAVYQWLQVHGPDLCPEVLAFMDDRDQLVLAYIPSITVLEALEKAERDQDIMEGERILSSLLVWLWDFYRVSEREGQSWIMGDVNLRNFLWTGEKIIGIDFENCRPGHPEEEIVRLMAFYTLYEPAKTAYKAAVIQGLMKGILAKTNRSAMAFHLNMNEEMERILERRIKQAEKKG